MRILTNGFPTNLPGSATMSQGGPANFAALFARYLAQFHPGHELISVMYENGRTVQGVERVHATAGHSQYMLKIPRALFRKVTRSKNRQDVPVFLLEQPLKRLLAFVREQKPDVVFLNGYGLFNWMLLKAADQAGVPVVIQHAGIWTKELRLHRRRYTPAGLRFMEQMEKESSRLASVEVFLNQWSRNYYRNHVAKGEARRIEIVPLPFDFGSFERLSANATRGRFAFAKNTLHIGVIGRWDKIKNHHAVLALAKKARKRGLAWQFHSVVHIPDTWGNRRIKRDYESIVDVIPPLDRDGISDFCRSVDLLIMPSLFDVSPTVVLEAMALDTPIVVSPTVGFAPTFTACGGRAWVVNPKDTERAMKRIAQVAGKKMPRALREKIIKMHDHREVFETYLQLFADASLRTIPMWEVVKTLFWREFDRYLPALR